jgi:hypothetical protein
MVGVGVQPTSNTITATMNRFFNIQSLLLYHHKLSAPVCYTGYKILAATAETGFRNDAPNLVHLPVRCQECIPTVLVLLADAKCECSYIINGTTGGFNVYLAGNINLSTKTSST